MFVSNVKVKHEINPRVCDVHFLLKRALNWRAKFPVYQSICIPALTYHHEMWVVKKITLRIKVAEMSFMCRVGQSTLEMR